MSDPRGLLRDAAQAQQPDRARMLARVERGMAGQAGHRGARTRRRPVFAWPRIALVSVAVSATCIVAFAVESVLDGGERQQHMSTSPLPQNSDTVSSPAAPTDEPSPSPPHGPDTTATPRGGATTGGLRPPAGTTPPPAATSRSPEPGARHTEEGSLWSDGSVVPGDSSDTARSDVTLKTQEPLTALTVELFLARRDGIEPTGTFQSLPGDDFTHSLDQRDGMLIHRWTLKAGRTVPPGTYVFAGRYDHAPDGRNAYGDTYRATAKTTDDTLIVRGDFARTS
ncbi:hypothetical protein [Streptomyces chryseus]